MSNMSELERVNEQMKQDNYDALEMHSQCIQELNVVDPVNVKEKDFKIYFLPVFKKEVQINEDNINRFINNIYILTKSYNKPLNIVDDKTGSILFRLPPITLDPKEDGLLKSINYTNLIYMYNVMNDSGNGAMANNKLAGLTNALGKIIKPSDQTISSYNDDIKFMYDRYNISYKKDENGEPIENTNVKEEEDIEYDYD